MEPSSNSLPFDLDDIYEMSPNLDDANSFMTPQVFSTQPLRTSQRSTKGQYLFTKYQDVDFTQPKHNSFFAQALASHVDNPTSIVVALLTLDAGQWQATLDVEYQSLNSNNTWRLENLPPNRSMVNCKWLFKHKYHVDGTIAKYKVRLVPLKFYQVEGLDYGETFFLVVKITSLRILIALTTTYDYHIHQMDVQTTFFHGHFNEEIFMQQPPGYVFVGRKTKVCRLLKTLYGLK
jgi:hypothetical protein